MSANHGERIDDHVRDTLARQFPGFEISPAEIPDIASALIGQIGFHTKSGVGSLGIVANPQTVRSLAPDIGGRKLDLTDWIGELANQTLGSVKIDLGTSMSRIVSSTQIVLRDACIRVCRSDSVRTFHLEHGEHDLGIWIDLTDVEIHAGSLEPTPVPEATGNGALFF